MTMQSNQSGFNVISMVAVRERIGISEVMPINISVTGSGSQPQAVIFPCQVYLLLLLLLVCRGTNG